MMLSLLSWTWQELCQGLNPGPEPVGDSASPVQPGNLLHHLRPAMVAVHPANRYIQPDATIKPVTLSDSSPTPFVNQNAGGLALPATGWCFRCFRELDQQGAVGLFAAPIDHMPFPEMKGQHSIRHGGGLDD